MTTSLAQTITGTSPDFSFTGPKNERLEPYFQQYGTDLQKEFTKAHQESAGMGMPWSLEASAEEMYEGKFVAVTVNGYDYRGGAHGLPILDVVLFDGATLQPISQSEWLVEGAYEELSRLARQGLVEQGFDPKDEWMLRGTEPVAGNYSVLVPSDEGLQIVFPPYQVAPYAAGTPSVSVPWSRAGSLLKPAYRP